MKRILLAALLLASCGTGGAAPDIQISDAWARETVGGQFTTAAYMTITNNGQSDDRLVAVMAPAPAMAMVHSTSTEYGITRMRPVEAVEVLSGGTALLAPGGTHIMVMRLQAPLKPGDTLPLTLRFEKSGERSIDLPVRSAL